MMRYRSAKTAPGVKATDRATSKPAMRPTLEGGVRGSGGPGADTSAVGSSESELMAEPQDGQ
jgi:hypothetical protein